MGERRREGLGSGEGWYRKTGEGFGMGMAHRYLISVIIVTLESDLV